MDNLEQVITNYLSAPNTDYAIMICGDWGCGKSYYMHHSFDKIVKRQDAPIYSDSKKKSSFSNKAAASQKYEPTYISLYGVSSVEDFEYRVFSGVNPWINNRFWRVSGPIASKILERAGISAKKKDLTSFMTIGQNKVLVFDDLERICEDKIPVKEVLGLINTYIEHSNQKVVIVCNEEPFLNNDQEDVRKDYQTYKEKSVRFSYEYTPNIGDVYDVMVSEKIDKDYKDFLCTYKERILYIFDLSKKRNLRTLGFFLDTFQSIHYLVKGVKYERQILNHYIVSYILYSIEHKEGHKVEDLYSLDLSRYRIDVHAIQKALHFDSGPSEEEKPKDFVTLFQEKYKEVYYSFRPSHYLIDYINSGYLDKEGIKDEILTLVKEYDKKTLTPEGIVINKLSQWELLSDEEVPGLVREMLDYVKEDKYDLKDLLILYRLLLGYESIGIEGFVVDDVIDSEFKASMIRQKDYHKFDRMFEVQSPTLDNKPESKASAKFNILKGLALSINRQAKDNLDTIAGVKFMDIVESGDIERMSQYRETHNNRITLAGIDWKRICVLLQTASNPVVCELCNCIISFIPGKGYLNYDEEGRIKEELLPQLDEILEKEKRVRRKGILLLKEHLKQVLLWE